MKLTIKEANGTVYELEGSVDEPDIFERAVLNALGTAVQQEIARHWAAGRSVPTQAGGPVVFVPPPRQFEPKPMSQH